MSQSYREFVQMKLGYVIEDLEGLIKDKRSLKDKLDTEIINTQLIIDLITGPFKQIEDYKDWA